MPAPPSPRRELPLSPVASPNPSPTVQQGAFNWGHSRTASTTSTISGIPHSPSLSGSSQPSRYLRRIPVPSPDGVSASSSPSAPAMSRQNSSSSGHRFSAQTPRAGTPTLSAPREATAAAPSHLQDRVQSPSPHLSPHSSSGGRNTPVADGRRTPVPLSDTNSARLDTVSPPPRSTSAQQQYLLTVDRPTKNMLPTYPPPPPPTTKPSRLPPPRKETKPKPLGKEISKRELYLKHKQKLSLKSDEAEQFSEQQMRERRPFGISVEAAGAIPVHPGHRDSTDNELSPLLLSTVPSTTWSLQSEIEFEDQPKHKIAKSRLKGPDVEEFSVDALPGTRRMWEAGLCEVQDQEGRYVPFSEIIRGDGGRRTAVFFIRHFWCGQCQDYMANSVPELDLRVLERHKIDVVIISNGHWQIIKKYRELFNCPFPIYVDGPRRLYNYLGMTRLNNDFGSLKQADRSRYNVNTVPGQLVRGIGNGLFRMPLRDPGKLVQLGGEFVFSNASTCLFAHRMVNTSDHMEAVDVLAGVGIDPEEFFPANGSTPEGSLLMPEMDKEVIRRQLDVAASAITEEEEARQEAYERDWEVRREAELERMRKAKEDRRAGKGRGGSNHSTPAHSSVAEFADAGNVFRRRGELDDDDDDDDYTDEMTDYDREKNSRPWTEDEQMEMLSQGLACVRVVEGDTPPANGDVTPPPTHGRDREDSSATYQTTGSQYEGGRHSSVSSASDSVGGLGGSR